MMQVDIVPFTPDDLDVMMEIENRAFTVPWTRSTYEELAPLSSIRIWVAWHDDELVGYMLYQSWGEEMELHSVAVKPELQRNGIGSQLLEHMLVEASKRGITHIYLLVRHSNKAARALYRTFGFEVVGVRHNYYQDENENALIMARGEDEDDA